MKKQETPAQPKVVPDAVVAGFPPPLKTAALRFPYAPKNSVCTRTRTEPPRFLFPRLKATTSRVRTKPTRRRIAAPIIRFHAELNLARRRTPVARPRNILKQPSEITAPPKTAERYRPVKTPPTKLPRPRQSALRSLARRRKKSRRFSNAGRFSVQIETSGKRLSPPDSARDATNAIRVPLRLNRPTFFSNRFSVKNLNSLPVRLSFHA